VHHAGFAPTALESNPVAEPTTLAVGTVLGGNFELVERLAGGGMGIVFRARDRRLGRDVAVKVLRAEPGDAGEHLRRLFEREARATAQLLHPNIVTLHAVGEHAGQPYLVLELLAGETLATRLARRGRLPLADVLSIMERVLDALAFAHERGVLHRDLKPHNVFLTADERIKVLDFGVAVTLDSDPGPITRVAGTPGYMAPEQRDGAAQDARVDVWAAALLFVECLIGRRVDEETAGAAIAELDAPPAIRAVLSDALAADPERRPASAGELRAALARAQQPAGPAFPRRSRWRVVAIVAAAIAATATATYFAARPEPEEPAPIVAQEVSRVWQTGFGVMKLRIDPDGTAYGVYTNREGVLMGRFDGTRIVGWWCEKGTRLPPDDAGLLELQLVRGPFRLLMDGRWKFGDSAVTTWRDDFSGFVVDGSSPRLEQRIAEHVTCPR